ncbi:hypothetical protein RESH_01380 [Rhodopirellula europaea SH398]|uniref:Uncharacterized protein n=1 Tax=Rhodopirellula europaea SH398 TaxID=1263868 RepID=M5S999_9BACT|nr:hypothetical protein RESH_01380 [Rhodopirellula europaea SH398]
MTLHSPFFRLSCIPETCVPKTRSVDFLRSTAAACQAKLRGKSSDAVQAYALDGARASATAPAALQLPCPVLFRFNPSDDGNLWSIRQQIRRWEGGRPFVDPKNGAIASSSRCGSRSTW